MNEETHRTRGGIIRWLVLFVAAAGLIGAGSVWLRTSALPSPEKHTLNMTKEEVIDMWFRSRTQKIYQVEIVGEDDTTGKVHVKYFKKDKIVGLVPHEATFYFDAKGKLYAIRGDEPVTIPRGVATR